MGKKYFTLSFDDGLEQDKKVLELMKKYGLRGTFNLNSGMFGQQLFRNVSAFTMTIIAGALSFLTTLSTLSAHIYAVLPFFFLLAATASISSIKLTQWLVNTVEHKILASTVGLLNTFAMASSPVMTTIFTTVSGMSDVRYALILLLVVEATVFFVTIKMSVKVKKAEAEDKSAAVVSE